MYDFIGKILDTQETLKILDKFKKQFLNDTYPERVLMINHLKSIEKIIPIERLREVSIPKDKKVFFYHERKKKIYITNFDDICIYVEQLEPWEDVDCLIFDEKLEWYLGITHSDDLYLTGIDDTCNK